MLSASAKASPLKLAIRHLNELAGTSLYLPIRYERVAFHVQSGRCAQGRILSRCLRSSSDEQHECLRVHLRTSLDARATVLDQVASASECSTWFAARHTDSRETRNECLTIIVTDLTTATRTITLSIRVRMWTASGRVNILRMRGRSISNHESRSQPKMVSASRPETPKRPVQVCDGSSVIGAGTDSWR